MIQLDVRPAAPAAMNETAISAARKECLDKAKNSQKFDFKGRNHWTNAKKDLWEYQNKKCCFCERKRDANAEADVEHFRPKGAVAEDASHNGYQWLAYDWDHLFYSCKKCNCRPNKGTQFPILGTRARVPSDNLDLERPLFIRPDLEDPSEYIKYEWAIYNDKLAKPEGYDHAGRGATTINALGLDSLALAEERAKLMTDLRISARALMRLGESDAPLAKPLYDETLKSLKQKIDKTSEFAGFARYFLKSTLGNDLYESLVK